ncbi:FG-GAP repeat protein [Streptomyces massasporeus]|uniref:FG-GAP repeat protein n=1 Tax=Streptomyces massasporeus TaxID=67324 RepID=UPI0037AFDD63
MAFAAPYAKVDGKGMAGYVAVVYGGATGLDPAEHTVISQNTAGVPGAAEAEDGFGEAIAPADLNGDGYTDLAVGPPVRMSATTSTAAPSPSCGAPRAA